MNWLLGDWIAYGEHSFGETYTQAIEQTGGGQQVKIVIGPEDGGDDTARYLQGREGCPPHEIGQHDDTTAVGVPASGVGRIDARGAVVVPHQPWRGRAGIEHR